MLYDGEKIDVWNPETGESMVSELESVARKDIDTSIEEARQLRSLTRTKGWKLLCKELQRQKEYYLSLIQNSDNFKMIRRLQEAIRASDNIHRYVQSRIQIGEQFEQQRTPQNEG